MSKIVCNLNNNKQSFSLIGTFFYLDFFSNSQITTRTLSLMTDNRTIMKHITCKPFSE